MEALSSNATNPSQSNRTKVAQSLSSRVISLLRYVAKKRQAYVFRLAEQRLDRMFSALAIDKRENVRSSIISHAVQAVSHTFFVTNYSLKRKNTFLSLFSKSLETSLDHNRPAICRSKL